MNFLLLNEKGIRYNIINYVGSERKKPTYREQENKEKAEVTYGKGKT